MSRHRSVIAEQRPSLVSSRGERTIVDVLRACTMVSLLLACDAGVPPITAEQEDPGWTAEEAQYERTLRAHDAEVRYQIVLSRVIILLLHERSGREEAIDSWIALATAQLCESLGFAVTFDELRRVPVPDLYPLGHLDEPFPVGCGSFHNEAYVGSFRVKRAKLREHELSHP